jgi:hypothetical protein
MAGLIPAIHVVVREAVESVCEGVEEDRVSARYLFFSVTFLSCALPLKSAIPTS